MKLQLVTHADERELETFIRNNGYVAQPKYDGVRVWLEIRNGRAYATTRGDKSRDLPRTVEIEAINLPDCTLDGELCGETLYVFDRPDLGNRPYRARLRALKQMPKLPHIRVAETAKTVQAKRALVARLRASDAEGIVFHDTRASYLYGKRTPDGAIAIKFLRYATLTARDYKLTKQNGALKYGHVDLYSGEGHFVGRVTVPPNFDHASLAKGARKVAVRYLYYHHRLVQPVLLWFAEDNTALTNVSNLKRRNW